MKEDIKSSKSNVSHSYSQLRAMMALALASFRSTLRSPSAVVFTLAFPLVFIVVFGFIGGGGFKMDVAADKNMDKSSPVFMAIEGTHSVNFIEDKSDEEIKSELEKGKIDGWLN